MLRGAVPDGGCFHKGRGGEEISRRSSEEGSITTIPIGVSSVASALDRFNSLSKNIESKLW
jgi:hypothetical protein